MRKQQKVDAEKRKTGVEIEHNRYEEINKIRGGEMLMMKNILNMKHQIGTTGRHTMWNAKKPLATQSMI